MDNRIDIAPSKPKRLEAIDLARALTAIAVVSIHAAGYAVARDNPTSLNHLIDQMIVLSLRFSRLVFMLLSGFALAYVYRNRKIQYGSFLARRGWRTAAPYAAWSLVYLAVSYKYGILTPDGPFVFSYLKAVLLGSAFYHLYFMTVSLQWYALFPGVIRGFRRLSRRAVAGAGVAVLVGYLALSLWLSHAVSNPALAWLLPYRDQNVVSYIGYYLLGTLAGLHAPDVLDWLKQRVALVSAAFVGMLAYLLLDALRAGPAQFTQMVDVYRPAVCLYGLVSVAFLLAISGHLAVAGGWLKQALMSVAGESYGIYLVHPLVLFMVEFYGLRLLPWHAALLAPLAAVGVGVSYGLVRLLGQIPVLAPLFLGQEVRRKSAAPAVPSRGLAREKAA